MISCAIILTVASGDLIAYEQTSSDFESARRNLSRYMILNKQDPDTPVAMALRFSNDLEIFHVDGDICAQHARRVGHLAAVALKTVRRIAELEGDVAEPLPRDTVYLARAVANQWAISVPSQPRAEG